MQILREIKYTRKRLIIDASSLRDVKSFYEYLYAKENIIVIF